MQQESAGTAKPDHLAAWIAEEERLWGDAALNEAPASISHAQLLSMSGLEVMQAIDRKSVV